MSADRDKDIRVANAILHALAEDSSIAPNWKAVLETHLIPEEYQSNVDRISRKVSAEKVIGAIAQGTSIIKDIAARENITVNQPFQTIKILKDNNKIHQCGRGRGVCVVVLDKNPIPLPSAQADQTEATEEAPSSQPTEDALQEAREHIQKLDGLLQKETETVAELRAMIEEKDAEIQRLQLTTWR